MSTISSVNDPLIFQLVVGACASLLVIVNGLVAFIVHGFKKDNEELKLLVKENNKEQRLDHDRINTLENHCETNHKH